MAYLTAHAAEACPRVSLKVSPSPTTLDQGKVGLQATLTPSRPPANGYEWDMKRADASTWTRFTSTTKPTFAFRAEVAGQFDVRVIATVDGEQIISNPQKLVVQFPSFAEIVADKAVRTATRAAWNKMISLVTTTTVQEVGFWIYIDSCTGNYGYTPPDYIVGKPLPPTSTDVGVYLGRNRPPDDLADPSVTGCTTYFVASFHTHTAETYAPTDKGRPVGPTKEDNALADNVYKVPGLVYDYQAEPGCAKDTKSHRPCISGGYPETGKATIYRAGSLDRRPLDTTPE